MTARGAARTAAMGTFFEVVVAHEDQRRAALLAEHACSIALDLHALWSPFERSSAIARLSRDAAAGWTVVDPRTFALLSLCRDVWEASGGRFDITVGPLMRAWGMRGGPARPDAPAGITRGMRHVELDAASRAVRFAREEIELDLGAIGKGAALDAMATELLSLGVECAFMHAGTSSALAIGAPPETGGWRVRISSLPDAPVVTLRDTALGVSAPSLSPCLHGERRPPQSDGDGCCATNLPSSEKSCSSEDSSIHILDPRTGRPVDTDLACTAVLCESAAAADAWSTALLAGAPIYTVAPRAAWLARRTNVDTVTWQSSVGGKLGVDDDRVLERA